MHRLRDTNLLINLYEVALKNPIFKNVVLVNGYLKDHLEQIKHEFAKLDIYQKRAWIRIISDINIDIALELCPEDEIELKTKLRVKRVSPVL